MVKTGLKYMTALVIWALVLAVVIAPASVGTYFWGGIGFVAGVVVSLAAVVTFFMNLDYR